VIPLFIPYVNRKDLLEKAVRSAVCDGVEINIINNSDGASIGIPGVDFIQRRPPVPLNFSLTQNWMLRIASGDADYDEDFYLFLHADAEAGEGVVQKMVDFARGLTKERRKWAVVFSAYDAFAAFNTQAFLEVGGWDEVFPWYFSDGSVYHKLRVAGYELVESNLPVKHEPSQTIKSDSKRAFLNSMTFPLYEYLYSQMWGGQPSKERFKTPFNR
jgi:hypothetical protein